MGYWQWRWLEVGWYLRAVNRPQLMVLVDGDDGSHCVLALHYGNRSSDPVFSIDLVLSGTRLGRWVSRFYWWVREKRGK